MIESFNKEQQIILNVLSDANCFNENNSIHPSELLQFCSHKGLSSFSDVEKALVSLIDLDIVEYQMDDNAEVVSIWIMQKNLQ